jgi:hypothetical protein
MRPYGYTTNQRTGCIDEELERGRAAAVEFLDNELSLSALVSEWNVRAYKTVTGKDWTEPSMRRMFLNPANAGLLPDGSRAPWPAMFDLETHRRLVDKLTDPDRRTGSDLEGRVYLLTGDERAVCALCGHPLTSNPSSPGVRSYVCATNKGGCGRIRVQADGLETFVATHVLARIAADKDGPDAIVRAHEKLRMDAVRAREQARSARDAVETMAGEFAVGHASKEAYLQVVAHAERLATESAELDQLAHVELPATIDDIAGWWNHAKVEDQRVLIDIFVQKVYVGSAVKRGSRFFDGDRVTLAWR